jgi:hypothetical protein
MNKTGLAAVTAVAALAIGGATWGIVAGVEFDHKCQDHGGHTVTEQTGWTQNTHYTYDAKGNVTGFYITTDPTYTTYCRDTRGQDVSW